MLLGKTNKPSTASHMREMFWYDGGEPELKFPRENMFWYDGIALPKVVVWRFGFLFSWFWGFLATLPQMLENEDVPSQLARGEDGQ